MVSNSDIIKNYLREHPNMSSHMCARNIYNENSLLFNSIEYVRAQVRYFKGSLGKKNMSGLKTDEFLTPEKKAVKYNLPEPVQQEEYKPFVISGNRGLILGDVHIPFQNNNAIETMLDYTCKQDLDFVLLNGDIMDCYSLSKFLKTPDKTRLQEEREKTKQFLDVIKSVFPKSKIFYKLGNHEKRLEDFLKLKAPELYGMPEYRLDVLLDLFNKQIQHIDEDTYIDLHGLSIFHFHELQGSLSTIAPAYSLIQKTKTDSLCAHGHRTSNYTDYTATGKEIKGFTVGCLCEMHPEYARINKWNHGFAIYERLDDNTYHVHNKRIINERIIV